MIGIEFNHWVRPHWNWNVCLLSHRQWAVAFIVLKLRFFWFCCFFSLSSPLRSIDRQKHQQNVIIIKYATDSFKNIRDSYVSLFIVLYVNVKHLPGFDLSDSIKCSDVFKQVFEKQVSFEN